MKMGLQIPYFTWPGGPPELGPKLADIVRTAEDAGFDSIWVMDHYFQIPMLGGAELDTMVTGVSYRHPGILVKQVTTLDVLSGGRAWLGIGAAWFEREHVGLGVRFPPIKERFERLEETLQIALKMWDPDDNGAFHGKDFRLAETLCVPAPLSRPHPPILVGGSGERKTLRLVARYADACNLFGDADTVRHKLEVLKEHCQAEGRDYREIEKTVLFVFNPGLNGENVGQVVDQLGQLAEAGAEAAIGAVAGAEKLKPLEIMGRDVLPQIAGF
jgi:alkanesulfonate monooxygenase SsuD/methylene tetrahydromethanopterin reductase-like flavin-dependent oxidoreductase (luciferase family)